VSGAAKANELAGPKAGTDFVRAMVEEDLASGRFGGRVITRFPPEPNGYLHIGHAKAICLDFGIAAEYGGRCHLRMDDTNPETEDVAYVNAIIRDIRWLGFDWDEHLYYASDYFEQFYDFAVGLIRKGLAYVDSSTEDEIREFRGTVTEPGRPTRNRGRGIEENLDLFARMRAGEFADGAHVLRARIDLASPNMLMRDPVLYRIRHASHYRRGDTWCIYPLYDYAHPLEDAIECVTHSLCTLEFENNRELYDWVVENCDVKCRPYQTEFARLELDYMMTSKRKTLRLVEAGHVTGWDDPRLPTIAGLRRRGVTPEAIRALVDLVGIARTNSRVDIAKLDYAIRDDLNQRAPRVLCVLDPLRVVITNYPEGQTETFEAPLWPHDVGREGTRPLPFSRVLYIDRADFMESPPPGFHRLAPGREVRLRYACIIRCDEAIRDGTGEIIELRCSYDPATRGGSSPDGRTVKGTIHWVSAEHSLPCEVRLYDRLFTSPEPESGEDGDVTRFLNPESLVVRDGARIEPSVANDPAGSHYQFERLGYFVSDAVDSKPGALVYNRTVTLRDTWKRIAAGESADVEGRPKRERPAPDRTAAPPPRERTRDPREESKYRSLLEVYGLGDDEASILARDDATAAFFEAAFREWAGPDRATAGRPLANWIINELPRELGGRPLDALPFGPRELAGLVELTAAGSLNSSAAREVLAEMARAGGEPAALMDRLGLSQISDEAALGPVVDAVLEAHASRVADYRKGRTGLIGFFMGQVMARSGGRANPGIAKRLLLEKLG
jgi:glutaminyl-tRNA synthetase